MWNPHGGLVLFARGLLLALVSLVGYGFERLVLHNPDVRVELFTLGVCELHAVKPGEQDVVIQTRRPGYPDAPLGGQCSEQVQRFLVLRPCLYGLFLEVLRPESPRRQLMVRWRGFVERCRDGLQFPRRPSTTAAR